MFSSRVRAFNWLLLVVCLVLLAPAAYFAASKNYDWMMASIGFSAIYCFFWLVEFMAMHDVYPEEIGLGPSATRDSIEASRMRRRHILTLAPIYYTYFEVRYRKRKKA